MKDAPLFDLLRQASIKTEKQLMVLSDYSCQYFLDTIRSTGAYIIFYKFGSIEYGAHFTGPVSQSIT